MILLAGLVLAGLVLGGAACGPMGRGDAVGGSIRAVVGTQAQDWAYVQQCGGLRVLDPVRLADGTVLLPVACDFGRYNSGRVVTETPATVCGDHIRLHIETGLAGARGLTGVAPPAVLRDLPPGDFAVEYSNPDGSTVALRSVSVPSLSDRPAVPPTNKDWLTVDDSWLRCRIARPEETLAGARVILNCDWPADARPFSPSPDDVRRAERGVVRMLLEACWMPDEAVPDRTGLRRDRALEEIPKIVAHLDEYAAQVAGMETGGHHRVVFNVFIDDKFVRWKYWLMVEDGGYHYWRIQYDLDEDRCLGFDSNGYG